MTNGVRSTDLDSAALIDEFLGNRDGSMVRVALSAAVDQIVTQAELRDIPSRVEGLEALGIDGYNRKQAVVAAATGNVALTGAYAVDGRTMSNGDRYLAPAQTNAAQNGVYVYNSAGAHARATDMNAAAEVVGSAFEVTDGVTNAGKVYKTPSVVATLGTDPITFLVIGDASALRAELNIKTPTPAYTKPGGQGDRSGLIKVTTSGIISTPYVAQTLVDGTTSGVLFNPGESVSSADWVLFDFGAGASKIINEVTFDFSSDSASFGTWKWQGSRDGVTFTDLGASFVLDPSGVALVDTTLSTNFKGWRFYRLTGVSGSVAASSLKTLQEVRFKIDADAADGVVPLPNTASLGETVRYGVTGWERFNPHRGEPEGRNLLNHYWPCDEGQGTILKDMIGGVDIDTADTTLGGTKTGGSIYWDDEGVLTLNNAWFGSPDTVTARTLFLVYEVGVGRAHYLATFPRNTDAVTTGVLNKALAKFRSIGGPGIRDFPHRLTDGAMLKGAAISGITGAWIEKAAQGTGSIFFGSTREDGAGALAYPYRLLCVATASGALTLNQVKKVRLFLAKQLAKRGHYLIPEVCPKRCGVAIWTGESTHHTSLVMDDDPTLAATPSLRQNYYGNTFLTGVDGPISDGAAVRPFEQLTYWAGKTTSNGKQAGNEGVALDHNGRAAKMGPLYGFAERHRYAPNPHKWPIFHMKLAVGGTMAAPVNTAKSGGGSVISVDSRHPDDAIGTLFSTVLVSGFLQYEAELRRMGYGVKFVMDYWAEGINDAYALDATTLPNDATYQGWLQTIHDRKKARLGIDPLPTIILVPHLPVPGAAETEGAQLGVVDSYPNNADGQRRFANLLKIRTACRGFATANADVTAYEGDDYALNTANGDAVHPSFVGLKDMGAAYRLAFKFDTPITEAFDG
ncbi:hypothetical protein T8T21_00655 [Limimaricola variabilis]|uniref:hypothetical protein n=1 Tax=Limimaricola variabilis TaxID=1492771 RepID=UPI002AC8EF43|nr:hypothetical protein [Limimaricola variabilis]WPY94669.1 hypothetical protein T8T21_00655 [Limimaricola variabilis]